MHKTTVYLPEHVRSALERIARQTGSSEAELIREALERLIASEPSPDPRLPLGRSGLPPCAERVDGDLAQGFGRG